VNSLLRRLVLLVFAGGAVVLNAAGPASADVAEGWSDPPPVSGLDMLWILLGAPLLCYLVVALLAYLPGLVKGARLPSKAVDRDDTWFSDPRL
jgi:hypothetical protein